MNKRSLNIIIVLMSLALVGLVGFQLFWLKNLYQLSKNRFDEDIKRALYSTAESLITERMKVPESILSSPYGENRLKATNFEELKGQYLSEISSVLDNIVHLQGSRFHPEVHYNKLDSILSLELDKAGIHTPYNYGVADLDNKFIHFNNLGIKKETFLTGYRVPILLNGINSPNYLHIYFPNKFKYLLESMWPILAASILLVIIISACFGYSIRVIIKQKKLSEIKNDFINNMTHELKTPISTVSLALEALTNFDVSKDPTRMMKYLEISKHENKRLSIMVEKVLNIAAYQRGDIKLKKENTDIDELAKKVVNNAQVQVSKNGGRIHYENHATHPRIAVDKVHITNIIVNLIDNANKYFRKVPDIHVSISNDSNHLSISIADKGIGINKEQQKRIFDKFYRVPTGNLHNVKGYGLGLSYVSDIVNMHNGSITVQSEINKGTNFIIKLPYHE